MKVELFSIILYNLLGDYCQRIPTMHFCFFYWLIYINHFKPNFSAQHYAKKCRIQSERYRYGLGTCR
jgi:hypothetical protein